MTVSVSHLCKKSGYSEAYFKQLLLKAKINNRQILTESDLILLLKSLNVSKKKSYDLYLYCNELLNKIPQTPKYEVLL